MSTLTNRTAERKPVHEAALSPAGHVEGIAQKPYIFNPYPEYNGKDWIESKKAKFMQCDGPEGTLLDDVKVFKGTPKLFPKPSFGSYDVLDIDGDLCFERETRLGPYGFLQDANHKRTQAQWDAINWGQLQEKCVRKNKARFHMQGQPNLFIDSAYGPLDAPTMSELRRSRRPSILEDAKKHNHKRRRSIDEDEPEESGKHDRRAGKTEKEQSGQKAAKEQRTALLIRTYTGKTYSDNDKHILRSLISELSLRTGGQYQVFLLVQVKDNDLPIWEKYEAYRQVVLNSVPLEFADMTILWDDQVVRSMYPKLGAEQASVHIAQWLSVQRFAQEYPEFDYVWNWELDSRLTGHHYDFLEKLVSFARKQPRRGLWERSERFYMPALHGDYDTDFRREVESHAVNGSVWGPPAVPFIKPIGPKPPVKIPEDDDYEWGVGEEADVITLAPIFDPVGSGWINWDFVWGFNDATHESVDVPRRVTIITQSRVSKKLLDIMHVENQRGNHVFSEMGPQTVALLHGLKAVYAPMPVFFDRSWPAQSLARWFNGGPNGDAGGFASAQAWGHEGRYSGSTWYYRANPPQRLYLNWMGWEDTAVGGPEWERKWGRPCLPPMILHPIKDVAPTEPGYESESWLPLRLRPLRERVREMSECLSWSPGAYSLFAVCSCSLQAAPCDVSLRVVCNDKMPKLVVHG
ncbi:hypothetical protein PG996_012060 [Apiospora saccharicola]|uniref:Uncharacterized protein n=1 Tax=Apiospora saccharicola TaxID=335842 RepID=A0ABR1U487_9PEZI